ncbi:putative Cytosolic iron-sulfur protein assembly protein 1 [Blattamonas nauphoetae]|uniref:Probable cytosolic iron-sulfur protein assembly protein CIAO1 homolog n=1 Tax=Blattamonas nauphoetae TaxID=2049346 RepID=A0ABQ9XMW5_9EUKA|nr:putative Cytosolic iron-sulfur protein assembly protein 1 [Blattamonas nauphoetae]
MELQLTKLCTLEGSTGRVWFLCWSPDGTHIATCGEDRLVHFWTDKKDGKWSEVWKEEKHTGSVRRVDWSPNGDKVASCSFDKGTILYNVHIETDPYGFTVSEEVDLLSGHEAEVKGCAFNKDGKLIATCSRDRLAMVWDIDQGIECLGILQGHQQDIKGLTWHPSYESILCTYSYDNRILFWLDPRVLLNGQPQFDEMGCYEQDWKVVEALEGHTSTVWDARFEPKRQKKEDDDGTKPIYGDSFQPRLVSASSDSSIIVWTRPDDAHPYAVGQTIPFPPSEPVYSADWQSTASDSMIIAAVSGDNAIRLFREDPTTHKFSKVVELLNAHNDEINCVRFSPTDPTIFATASDDGTAVLWKITSQ